jgi:hypothetical protein
MNELDLPKLQQELKRAERSKENIEDRLKLLAVFDGNFAVLAQAQLELEAAAAQIEDLKKKIAAVEKHG